MGVFNAVLHVGMNQLFGNGCLRADGAGSNVEQVKDAGHYDAAGCGHLLVTAVLGFPVASCGIALSDKIGK